MTKADIVNEISKSTGIEKVIVQKTVESFMDAMKDSMVKGNNALLSKKELKKQQETFPRTQLLSFPNILFPLSNLLNPL